MRPPRALVLLWIGASLGLVLALAGLASSARDRSKRPLSTGVAAVVNGVPILKGDYDGALRAISDSARRPVTDRDKEAAVTRLVDDELMIEYGLELGLARSDPTTRQALLSAVFSAERSRGSARTPADADLEQYYEQIRPQLQRPGKVHLRQIVTRARPGTEPSAARALAEEAASRLRSGEPFESVRAALESPDERPVPDRALSVDELTSLVGPITVKHALELTAGQVSDVIGGDQVFRVVQVVEKDPPEIPTFEEDRAVVLRRYREKCGDDAFAAKLAELRSAAEIRVAPVLP